MRHYDVTTYFGSLCRGYARHYGRGGYYFWYHPEYRWLAGSLTTNLWVRIGERRGYFKTISYCMLGSGVVLLLQSLPVRYLVVWVLQVLLAPVL